MATKLNKRRFEHAMALVQGADPIDNNDRSDMPEDPNPGSTPIPEDDRRRRFLKVNPDEDEGVRHISLVGDTYTILVSGDDTAGRYTLIDMLIPKGGGPPPHRHDFEEMFSVLEGEIEVTFREEKLIARAGDTVNVPANAPHRFTNSADHPARLLCMCTPAGQEEFFALVGEPVPSRTSPPPQLDSEAKEERMKRAVELAPKYRTELLKN
jgi:quercetin dioxygenase-like cupin family protein